MVGRSAIIALVLVGVGVSRAAADDPSPTPPNPELLVAEGEELARQGEFTRAIEKFKQADGILPRARNACLIGLAYTRREQWSQAEIFLGACHDRASATDPAPDWLGEAEQTLAGKLAEVAAAAVDIRVEPAGTPVALAVFLPDETFTPRVLHLTPGSYVITATAVGYETTKVPVEITDATPRVVTVVLKRPGEDVVTGPVAPPRMRPRAKLGKWLLIGAAGAAVIGGGFHVLAFRERDQLAAARDANDLPRYTDHEGAFDAYRAVTFACYGAAIAAGAIGAVLHYTHDREQVPVVGASITPGGAIVTLGWER